MIFQVDQHFPTRHRCVIIERLIDMIQTEDCRDSRTNCAFRLIIQHMLHGLSTGKSHLTSSSARSIIFETKVHSTTHFKILQL